MFYLYFKIYERMCTIPYGAMLYRPDNCANIFTHIHILVDINNTFGISIYTLTICKYCYTYHVEHSIVSALLAILANSWCCCFRKYDYCCFTKNEAITISICYYSMCTCVNVHSSNLCRPFNFSESI